MITNNARYAKYAAALAAATTSISSASAALVAWGAFNNDPSASTEVNTAGTFVEAVNLVPADALVAGATVTVNGVTFTGSNLFGNNYSFSSGVDTGDADLNSLYANFGYNGGDITLSGLTIGRQYQIQAFYGDNRGCCNGRMMAVGTTLPTAQATSAEAANDGSWVIGTFTADATTQTFFTTFSGATTTEINAYSVRDVTPIPEPTSTAFIGLSALAFILRRRKS